MDRFLGRALANGDLGLLRNFRDRSIHYSYGEELNESLRYGMGDKLLDIASGSIGTAILGTAGASILLPSVAETGVFNVSSNIKTAEIAGNVAFELAAQTSSQLANQGNIDITRYDIADIALSATKLNVVGSNIIGSIIDIDLTDGLDRAKSMRNMGIDLSVGMLIPGTKSLGRSISTSKSHKFINNVLGATMFIGGNANKNEN